ncbi:MAG: GGDEF domain-containing protein [Rhodanobacter sp.]
MDVFMQGSVIAGMMLAVSLAHDGGMSVRDAQRYRTETDPHALIAELQSQLNQGDEGLTAPLLREKLWLLGAAAVNVNDVAALHEATTRLDAIGRRNNDPAAAANAGFLRSRQIIASSQGDGISDELQAAALVQDTTDPVMLGRLHYTLCDAYVMSEQFTKALPLCRRSIATYRAQADAWGMGNAQNDLGILYTYLDRFEDAIPAYLEARKQFASIGAQQMVVLVGDNLSQAYRKTGHVREALALSRTSLAQELATGRTSDAIGSRTNIALAEVALGRPHRALELMDGVVSDARNAQLHGLLPDLLLTRSKMEQAQGKLAAALADTNEVITALNQRNAAVLRSDQARLEASYATREKELQILSLQRQNQVKDLQLRTAQAETARRREQQRRQSLGTMLGRGAVVALSLIALLLGLLLRSQRRHAAALRALALRDPLTGVENRRGFQQRAMNLLAESPGPLAPPHVLMLIDVDHFKRINDAAGHSQGDYVLRTISDGLRRVAGTTGHVARIGGEEFMVLCPRCGAMTGMQLAESLRAAVAALVLPAEVGTSKVTISIGVAVFDGTRCHDLSSWMRAADTAMYEAKSHGRNRVVASALAH